MVLFPPSKLIRPLGGTLRLAFLPRTTKRLKRYEAFDTHLDKDALAEARSWFAKFDATQLPHGNTTYARSSGPGGQHVNKTETKAITVYAVKDLLAVLPQSLHSAIRSSRYHTSNNDALTFHAQSHRSRTANLEENGRKLMEEVTRIYHENTPSETSKEKKEKHKEIAVKFHDSRIRAKKAQGSKKQSRKGSVD